jgi:uncharacterized protein YcaQ
VTTTHELSRRWGYFALPSLYGDQLIGKVDATADAAGRALKLVQARRCRFSSLGQFRRWLVKRQ